MYLWIIHFSQRKYFSSFLCWKIFHFAILTFEFSFHMKMHLPFDECRCTRGLQCIQSRKLLKLNKMRRMFCLRREEGKGAIILIRAIRKFTMTVRGRWRLNHETIDLKLCTQQTALQHFHRLHNYPSERKVEKLQSFSLPSQDMQAIENT